MLRPIRLVAAASALFAVGALGPACAPASDPIEDEEAMDGAQSLSVSPGDPYGAHGVTVFAPEAGRGIYAEVMFENGDVGSLHIRTLPDGSVFSLPDDGEDTDSSPTDDEDDTSVVAEAAGEASASGSPGPCSDRARKLLGYKWTKPYTWSFQSSSTPSSNSVANVEAKLKAAANNITGSRNSCGMSNAVSAKHAYAGRTTRGTQIGADASCKGTGDGFNTIGFGALPDGILGLACVWYDGDGHAIEADVRLTTKRKWFAQKPDNCSGRFSVEGVATHEIGHVFGLGHVSEGAHGNLTMSTAINGTCESAEATLGKGDVLGLRALY
ncbi:MAG TPA: matrixin family metalloprotease [Polyangiaceae bacterium]|nr:matrixin family metalloprotease [Polyangiaceae bacterium]